MAIRGGWQQCARSAWGAVKRFFRIESADAGSYEGRARGLVSTAPVWNGFTVKLTFRSAALFAAAIVLVAASPAYEHYG